MCTPHGKRRDGGPYTLHAVPGYHEVNISAYEIATLAEDRCAHLMAKGSMEVHTIYMQCPDIMKLIYQQMK